MVERGSTVYRGNNSFDFDAKQASRANFLIENILNGYVLLLSRYTYLFMPSENNGFDIFKIISVQMSRNVEV
jgi:hypothetical protein